MWNFEARDDGVYKCEGDHERSEGCVYEKMTYEEIVDIIEAMKSQLRKEE